MNQREMERDTYLRERDEALGERNELLRQRDQAIGERNEYLRQRDEAIGERNELRRQLDEVIGTCNELQRQRDEALGERNELRRQLDLAIGAANSSAEVIARHRHRAEMAERQARSQPPAAGTRDRLLLFLHLAKTGGMTLATILARNFAIDEFLQIRQEETEASAIGTWSPNAAVRALGRLQSRERLRAVWGHYGLDVQSRLPRASAIATMLREPVERAISSHYYFIPPGESLDHYVAQLSDCHVGFDNYLTRVLSGNRELNPSEKGATLERHRKVGEADFEAALKTIDNCLLAGVTEQFDETLLILGSDLGWTLTDLVYTRINATKDKPRIADISAAVREKLLRLNSYDSELVARARTHLERRIQSYPGEFERDLMLFRRLKARFEAGANFEELRQMEYEATRP